MDEFIMPGGSGIEAAQGAQAGAALFEPANICDSLHGDAAGKARSIALAAMMKG